MSKSKEVILNIKLEPEINNAHIDFRGNKSGLTYAIAYALEKASHEFGMTFSELVADVISIKAMKDAKIGKNRLAPLLEYLEDLQGIELTEAAKTLKETLSE